MEPVNVGFEQTLARVPALASVDSAQLGKLCRAFESRAFPDGYEILRQGAPSAALYLLHRGTVAVRIRRGARQETVAELQPPAFFGELSFLTGRSCSASVEAIGTVEVGVLPLEALAPLGPAGDALLRALLPLVARRLHDTMSGTRQLARPRTIWLRADAAFPAPLAFAAEFVRGLQARAPSDVLVVADGLGSDEEPRPAGNLPFAVAAPPDDPSTLGARLHAYGDRFRQIVVVTPHIQPPLAADVTGDLVAGVALPLAADSPRSFVAADAARTRLDRLAGRRQLVFDTDAAEAAWRGGTPIPPRFARTARSLARGAMGRQVGLALGGGGACCWAHVGMLAVLEEAGIPVDMVAGCSMGSLVGGLYCAGRTVTDLTAIAESWRVRYKWMIEPRLWRMHAVSDSKLERALGEYFGGRRLTDLEVPFCANAVDIETGEEVVLDRIDVATAVRASMALPGSWSPVDLGGQVLVDAAIMAPVPVGPVRAMGPDFIVAMNVMPPMRPAPLRRRNPMRFFDVLNRSLRISGHEIGNNRAAGECDVMLTPALESHSLSDFSHCHEIIRAGVAETRRHLPHIVAGYRALVDAET